MNCNVIGQLHNLLFRFQASTGFIPAALPAILCECTLFRHVARVQENLGKTKVGGMFFFFVPLSSNIS